MEIKDEGGNIVRTFSSKADSTYKKYNGGPSEDPLLTKAIGLNRFVWNMRHATIPGILNTYIDGSYLGHKSIPGKYTVTIKTTTQKTTTNISILANPLYATNAETYKMYDKTMSSMETTLTTMHQMINIINAKRQQLEQVLTSIPAEEKYTTLKIQGQALVKRMKEWDEEMIQRKSKAYDDVKNFPNKFTANYMYLINQTESDLPSVNQPSIDLMKELNIQWAALKERGTQILDKDIPAFNQTLWQAGIGAIWQN